MRVTRVCMAKLQTSPLLCAPSTKQIAQHVVSAIVQGFEPSDFELLFADKRAEAFEESLRLPDANGQSFGVAVKSKNVIPIEQSARDAHNAIAAHANRVRMIVEQFADLRDRANRGEAAGSQDRDLIGEAFERVEFVARYQQAFAALGQQLKQSDHLAAADGVDAVERFVEQEQRRVVKQSLSELHALPHAFRIAGERAIGAFAHANQGEHIFRATPRGRGIQTVHAGHGDEKTSARKIFGKGVEFRDKAQAAFCAGKPRVKSLHRDAAEVGARQPCREIEERTLASAVVADQTGDAGP